MSVSKSINNYASSVKLETSEAKITTGQGEYVVFHSLPNGEKKELARETFEQAYEILNYYAPAAIVSRGSDLYCGRSETWNLDRAKAPGFNDRKRVNVSNINPFAIVESRELSRRSKSTFQADRSIAAEECSNRYNIIKTKVKGIDPTLEVIFVPRTLYELVFIRKCIREDLKHKRICPNLSPSSHGRTVEDFEGDQQKYESYLKEKSTMQAERKCWHLCYFDDAGDNDHAGIREVAYRLNQAIVKAFSPTADGLTYQKFSTLAEKEIEFLKAHHKKGSEEMKRLREGEKVDSIASCKTPGPTTNFGYESTRDCAKPMGIRNETDAQIVRNAIAIDCSEIAKEAVFLYRGANFQKDSPYDWSDQDKPYSLSYGTSLFAGCLYDGGATAFYYMRTGQNAYAVPVPFDQLNNSPFYTPPTNGVSQLYGNGEIFHGRSKGWKGFDIKKIGGIDLGANGDRREHLKSNLTRDELITQFQQYKSKAIQLKYTQTT